MGSFNMTCFASNQTIAPGDPCRVLPILQQSTYNSMNVTKGEQSAEVFGVTHSTCYYEGFWSPVGNFLRATYDDYGRVELELDDLARQQLIALFAYLVQYTWVTPQGDNEYHDLAYDLRKFIAEKAPALAQAFAAKTSDEGIAADEAKLDEDLIACWVYTWEVSGKNRIFASNYRGEPRPLAFALIHEAAYAELVESQSTGSTWSGENVDPTSFLRKALDEALAVMGERALTDKKDIMFASFRLSDKMRDRFAYADGTGKGLGGPASAILSGLCDQFMQNTLTEDEFIAELVPLLEDRYLFAALNNLNLRITPAVTGDQAYQNETGIEYAQFVSKVSNQVTRGRITHMFGEFKPYSMSVNSQEQLDDFVENVNDWDAAIEAVVATPAADGTLAVQFDCTIDFDDLRETIKDNLEGDTSLMLQSLTPRETAE